MKELDEMEDHLIEEIDYLVKQENLTEEEAFHKAVKEIGKREELSNAVTIVKKEKNVKKRWRLGISLVLLLIIVGASSYVYKSFKQNSNEIAINQAINNKAPEEKNNEIISTPNKFDTYNNKPSEKIVSDEALVGTNPESINSFLQSYLPNGFPCPGPIDVGFGYRIHPIFRTPDYHTGVDIVLSFGFDITATGDGTVTGSGWEGGYGYMVTIQHIYGVSTRYAHCSRLLVKKGDQVKRGQSIAKAGATGSAVNSHVHYEILLDDRPVDPKEYNQSLIKNYYAMIKNDFMTKR
jgi:murein DD-endopeptidase MepM/ murein hydrolase activator NlpD